MVDLTGFQGFLQRLKNEGMQPTLVGDVSLASAQRPVAQDCARPYLVR